MPTDTALPPMQVLTTVTQWLDCSHHGTTVLPAGADSTGLGVVALAPVALPVMAAPVAADPGRAGLVVTPQCRVYHSIPELGRLDELVWDPADGTSPHGGEDLFGRRPDPETGDFRPEPAGVTAPAGGLRVLALALAGYEDDDGARLLALTDGADGEPLVAFDLIARRVVRRLTLHVPAPDAPPWTVPVAAPAATAVDVATGVDGVLVACASRAHPLWRVGWRAEPVEVPVPPRSLVGLPAGAVPSRVAADPSGRIWLLWLAPGAASWATPVVDERTSLACGPLAGASDIELDGSGALVVAGAPGADLRQFRFADAAALEDRPLRARRADGRGLARSPDGRIMVWTAAGLRAAFPGPMRYGTGDGTGATVHTTALDSGTFRQRWGRIFLDACVPEGTSVSVAMLAGDDLPGDEFDGMDAIGPLLGELVTIERQPPANVPDPPPAALAVLPLPAADAVLGADHPVYRRGAVEQPWVRRAADDPFVTYEAPVNAAPGRYLWLRLRLTGTPHRTPRIRAVRVETSGPRLLERLPQVFSEEATAAAFLDRYLQLANVTMADLAVAADERHVLMDPVSAPPELLPWLASLVGLMLDQRWPEAVRRTMIAEAVGLFRRRGTVGALKRMAEIVLGVAPVLVERYSFRGLTGSVGTTLIRTGSSFAEYAHRFSVIVPGAPSALQLAMLHELITVHRPAHTVFEICSASTGSRLGIGLHLDLTAVIGRSAGFEQLDVGGVLGRGAVLGRPDGALRVGAGSLGRDARVEP